MNCASCITTPSASIVSDGSQDLKVWYQVYRPSEEKALNRTVIIFPPTGGVTYLERSYASALVKKGATVKVLQKWSGMDESSVELELHQRLHEKAMQAVEQVISSCPETHKISLMGTSVGGIFAAVAASKFQRIDRVLSVAGGSPIPELIVHSDYKTIKELREKRFEKFGFENKAEYLRELNSRFKLNPHTMPHRFMDKKLGQVILLRDKSVPTLSQKKLQQLWEPTFLRTIDAGHFFGIVKAWWFFSDEIVSFLVSQKDANQH